MPRARPKPGKATAADLAIAATAAADVARPWLLYLLECGGGKLYAGISPDVEARFAAHCAGSGARFTRANRPLRILAAARFPSRAAAAVAEYQLKQLARPEKLQWAQAHRWPADARHASNVEAA
ncbi:MAG: putative endonuclease containing a domain [Nevskia sp.]|nr:putative endonuclease containing a domain [Nevskia sp.]